MITVTPERDKTRVARRAAIRQGLAALQKEQKIDGSFQSDPDMGPLAIAMTALTEWWLGTLTAADSAGYARSLQRAQRKDGGFDLHPYAYGSTLGPTAVCRAALKACGVADRSPSVRAAERRIAALGGYEVVRDRMASHGEPAALFCVMVGLLPADALPPISPDWAALPWSERMLDGRLHAGVPMVMYACAAVRERFTARRLLPRMLQAPTRMFARARLSAYIGQFQNPNGSWNGMVFSTAFALLALEGVGLNARDPMVARGLAWLATRKRSIGNAVTVVPFDGELWETAFSLLALAACGQPTRDVGLREGAAFLRDKQCAGPQLRVNQPKAGAPRTGGWSFMCSNDGMPDTDDTAVVLAALGVTAGRRLATSADEGIARGVAWLRGMQNDSGGWGAYVHGLPDKPKGLPAFVRPPPRWDDLRNLPGLMLSPPPELGDPATADLCGRILWGLGECGLSVADPMVERAVRFLEQDQCADGCWWGVWNPAYVAGTAFALIGLASVGADLHAPFVARAVDWLLSVQNEDGGFGEDYRSFQDPSLAGVGPSMPPLTGIALRALADVLREAPSPALRAGAARAASYLVESQGNDGVWPDGGYLFTIVPPTLYSWQLHKLYYVLFGLGRYDAALAELAARSQKKGARRARPQPRA